MSADQHSRPSHDVPTALPDCLSGPILITGAGVSGVGCAKLVRMLGVEMAIADDNPASAEVIAELGAEALTTAHARERITEFSCVITSPGWRPDSPVLVDATSANIPVLGDVEVAYLVDRAELLGPRRTWLAITGTNGKTTTTAMLAEMMQRHNPASAAVGNIGTAIPDALLATPRVEVLVAELSSFQLHWTHEFTPDCGCVLNLAEDHIDWHGSFAHYGADKARILRGAINVLGVDDEHVRAMEPQAAGRTVGFTLAEPEPGQVGVAEGWIVDRAFVPESESSGPGIRIRPIEGISPAGRAGQLDALAATAMARSQSVAPADIAAALDSFGVAAHRGQVVHQVHEAAGTITVIDNSKATNPHAADAALKGFSSILWVAGGQLKGADVSEVIRTHGERMVAAALLGVDAPLIAEHLGSLYPQLPVFVSTSTDKYEAMAEIAAFAREHAVAGVDVILAPAAASLDMYSGMGERGDIFAEAMRAAFGTSGGGDV
ncbi:UDP-N-acetylmuramoylalanine--D-glutamate ligase [Corynebacterium ciconiae DSM 44920]|uniref:UDP-N-acetylmuramoyl-L-alanine--D-glutamate ligase n=1 Tax=Corynebacterium ciconiae TaxID=227319 RepID=UPI000360C762|nr:UDP-N-acetylmuramoyl-L-alanine--D-glutamate ligase [Corynebacterium ciconiae]WKD60783.1 UDP-N-acetylmuramoylalanine--D-glutamate ligase [Corynebacterium ciconiae DSM 44920]